MKEEEEEEDDERREAAIASAASSLQPNFNHAAISNTQLSKFQELHRRRLQIKSKSKNQKKSKGITKNSAKLHGKNSNGKDHSNNDSCTITEVLSDSTPRSNNLEGNFSMHQDNGSAVAPKKRQKLRWGLDTKERWEMKANM